MKKIMVFSFLLIFLASFFTGCAYYPVKKELKFNNLSLSKGEIAFNVMIEVEKEREVKISKAKIKEIEDSIVEELSKKGIDMKKDSHLLMMIHIMDYEEGNLTLRLLGGTLHGAGKASIKASIIIVNIINNHRYWEKIQVEMGNNPFNLNSIYGSEKEVQKKFAKEIAASLAKILK